MVVEIEFAINVDAQVFGRFYYVEFGAMNGVFCVYDVSFLSYPDHLAFVRVEGHAPLLLPYLQIV